MHSRLGIREQEWPVGHVAFEIGVQVDVFKGPSGITSEFLTLLKNNF